MEPDDLIKKLLSLLKWFFGSCGILGLLFFTLSFTDLPYYAYHYLGTCNAIVYRPPQAIVLLGGGGMPSPDGFIRCFYTAQAAKKFTKAKIIIALPGDASDSLRQLNLMKDELVMRGIDPARISFEPKGFNTHSQASNISSMIPDHKNMIMLITAPEHMYRAINTFKGVGFVHVCGSSTFEKPPQEEMVEDSEGNDGTSVNDLNLRYNTWSYMQYELLVLKEYCAISYYWMKGWI